MATRYLVSSGAGERRPAVSQRSNMRKNQKRALLIAAPVVGLMTGAAVIVPAMAATPAKTKPKSRLLGGIIGGTSGGILGGVTGGGAGGLLGGVTGGGTGGLVSSVTGTVGG